MVRRKIAFSFALMATAFVVVAAWVYPSAKYQLSTISNDSHFRMAGDEGLFFFQLSETLSDLHESQLTIIPAAEITHGKSNALTEEGRKRSDALLKGYHDALNKRSSTSLSMEAGEGVHCAIKVAPNNWSNPYRFIDFETNPLGGSHLTFWHEVGHCVHRLYGYHQDLYPEKEAISEAIEMVFDIPGVENADEIASHLMGYEISAWDLVRINLYETFADIYSYAAYLENDGDPSDFMRNYRIGQQLKGDLTHYTSPLFHEAEDVRSKDGLNIREAPDVYKGIISHLDLEGYIVALAKGAADRDKVELGMIKAPYR